MEIRTRLDKAVEEHVPIRRSRVIGKPKWLNNEILSLIGKKRKAWDKWKKCKSKENELEYKKLEKGLKKKIRESSSKSRPRSRHASGSEMEMEFSEWKV